MRHTSFDVFAAKVSVTSCVRTGRYNNYHSSCAGLPREAGKKVDHEARPLWKPSGEEEIEKWKEKNQGYYRVSWRNHDCLWRVTHSTSLSSFSTTHCFQYILIGWWNPKRQGRNQFLKNILLLNVLFFIFFPWIIYLWCTKEINASESHSWELHNLLWNWNVDLTLNVGLLRRHAAIAQLYYILCNVFLTQCTTKK